MKESLTALRRSPLYRRGRENLNIDGGCLVASAPLLTKPGRDGDMVVRIQDESARARVGFKGAGTTAWLSHFDIAVTEGLNRAVSQRDLLVGRLGEEEYLLLAATESRDIAISELVTAFSDRIGSPASTVALIPRQSSYTCLRLNGSGLHEILAMVCSVECTPEAFQHGQVLQTVVANCSAVMIREGADIMLVCDSTLVDSLLSIIEQCLAD
jgi:sarcosine oxidase subunit gamma